MVAGARHLENLGNKLDGYERILSKQKYLAGDVSTIFFVYTLYSSVVLTTCIRNSRSQTCSTFLTAFYSQTESQTL